MGKWELAKLEAICDLNMGQSPESSSYNQDGDGIPFYQGNADFGELNPETRYFCNKPTKIAKKDDILLSVRAPIGALNIATETCCIGRGLAALTAQENLTDMKFLYYVLKRNNTELNQKGTGSTFKAINKQNLSELACPLPPIETQKRIAKTLDTTTELLAMRKRQVAELDELIKSTFYEMFGDPVTNSMEWDFVKLGDAGELKSGGTPTRTNSSYFLGEIDWYSAGELNQRYLLESKEKLTLEAITNSAAKVFNKASMLIGMYDTAAFKLGVLTKDSSSNQACANIDVNKDLVNIEWLYDCAQIMRPYFLKNRRGVRQQNLNLGMIKNFEIPLPPLLLQTRFADIVIKIEEQKALVKKAIDETQYLFDSLMSEYFE